jgi:hypothetical protein
VRSHGDDVHAAKMRVSSRHGEFLELETSHKPECSGELFLVARMQLQQFSAQVGTYIQIDHWLAFTKALVQLRMGSREARLIGNDLQLRIVADTGPATARIVARPSLLGVGNVIRFYATLAFEESELDALVSAADDLSRHVTLLQGYLTDELNTYNNAYASDEEPTETTPSLERARVYRWAGILEAAIQDCDALLAQRPGDSAVETEKTYALQAVERRKNALVL